MKEKEVETNTDVQKGGRNSFHIGLKIKWEKKRYK